MEKGQIAVITDAFSPAAEAIAERLEKEGLTVFRNYPRGLPQGLDINPDSCFRYDTCSEAAMKEFLGVINDRAGHVNFLIHTDNVVFRSNISEITEEEFKSCMNQNAKSAFITTRVFGQHMAEHAGKAILYLSSLHDEKPTGCAFAYSTAKGAVKMLCKEMALFFGRKGIRVNLIEMACIKEEEYLFDSKIVPLHYDSATKIPLHRTAVPGDFAGVAAFLLSEDAAFINGAEIRVDGGHLLYYGDR
jgi:glucose 1-dehydrogenase